MLGGFSPLPHVEHENQEADTHVESHDDVLSDAGSTPAASTIHSMITRRLPAVAFGEGELEASRMVEAAGVEPASESASS